MKKKDSFQKAKVASTEMPKKNDSTAYAFIHEGQRLLFEMADSDVCDAYTFTIDGLDDGLVLRFEGVDEAQNLTFTADALETARGFVMISQGAATAPGGKKLPGKLSKHLPPFLLSRTVFAELHKNGESTILPEWGDPEDGPTVIRITGTAQVELPVDGKKVNVSIFEVQGGGVRMWVVNDHAWPFVVFREESDDSYWRFAAAGAELPSKKKAKYVSEREIAFTPFETEAARKAAKVLETGDAGALKILKKKSASTPDLTAAIEKCGASTNSEVRQALMSLSGHSEFAVSLAAKKALGERNEPGFTADLFAVLSREIEAMTSDVNRVYRDPHWKTASALLWAVSFDVSRDPQVVGLWREVVRTHPSAIVRSEVARRYLYCFDEVICAHLVGLVDAPEPVESGMVGRIVDAIGLMLPPEEGKAKFESLAARVNDASVWFNIAQDGVRKPGAWETVWLSTVIGWWREHHANPAARLQISRIFRDGTPVPWRQGLDLQKKEDVLTLLEILRTNEVGRCSDPNWDVYAFAASAPVEHLPLLAEGVFSVAYGNDLALFEALAKVHDASVLAPILAERFPETCKVWESMLENLLMRDAKGWHSLLAACRKFLTTNDPKSAYIARIEAHLGK